MELKPEDDINARRRDHGQSYWARDEAGALHLVGSREPVSPGSIPPELLNDGADPHRNLKPME